MQRSDDRIPIEIATNGCEIPEDERTRMQAWVKDLSEHVEGLTQPALRLHAAFHPQNAIYNVELKLKLPGRSLFVREKDFYLDSALKRGFEKLNLKLESYRRHMDNEATAEAGRRAKLEDLVSRVSSTHGPLASAVDAGDYQTFRNKLSGYEAWINRRAGRWIQRDADAQSRLGAEFILADVVEEVFLNAFERFHERSPAVPFGEWLDGLIQPSIRALIEDREEEKEAVSFARTLREVV
jgi:hypothetical protein